MLLMLGPKGLADVTTHNLVFVTNNTGFKLKRVCDTDFLYFSYARLRSRSKLDTGFSCNVTRALFRDLRLLGIVRLHACLQVRCVFALLSKRRA